MISSDVEYGKEAKKAITHFTSSESRMCGICVSVFHNLSQHCFNCLNLKE